MDYLFDTYEHPFGVKEYYYHNIFSNKDVENIIDYLHKEFYDKGIISYDVPGYQTPGSYNLFIVQKPEFQKLKTTFLESVKKYINQQQLIDNINSDKYNIHTWCYMNWELSGRNYTDEKLKHIHNTINPNAVSGIFYLRLPGNRDGETEFHLGCNKFKLPSKELRWFLFPSNYAHTPGKVTSEERRYVLSVDIWFK